MNKYLILGLTITFFLLWPVTAQFLEQPPAGATPSYESGAMGIGAIIIILLTLFVVVFLLIPLVMVLLKKKVPFWLKGGSIAGIILIIGLVLIMGLLYIANGEKGCTYFDDPTTSFINCVAPVGIIGTYALIPVILIGVIVAYFKNKK